MIPHLTLFGYDNLTNHTNFQSSNASDVCVKIDHVIHQSVTFSELIRDDIIAISQVTTYSFLVLLSVVSLGLGARVIRPLSIVGSCTIGIVASYMLQRRVFHASCVTSVITSGLVGLLSGLLSFCLLKLAVFAVAAVSFGLLAHFLFLLFPALDGIGELPRVFSKSSQYWIAVLASAIVGGIVARCQTTSSMQILTSIAGSSGLVYCAHSLFTQASIEVNSAFLVLAGAVMSVCGFLVQRCDQRRLKRMESE